MASATLQSQPWIRRFRKLRLLEHHLNALVFLVLVATGLAQRHYSFSWAQWLILEVGGIDQTRVIHRYAGALFAILILQHIAVALSGVLFRNWRASMVVNRNDFQAALTNLKYYLGFLDRPARCDRYDYRQKFEYWGVVLGGILMAVTGLILCFPVELFKLVPVLPGQIIPAAKAAHGYEAMLAFLVIVIWHIYNSVFSPEVFPLDAVIFTGKISRERMIHEHPLEYERMTGTRLEDPPAGSPAAAQPRADQAG
ncbi:MAG: formate dehydrogenase subunit gamma [Acidobacteriota bacterium]